MVTDVFRDRKLGGIIRHQNLILVCRIYSTKRLNESFRVSSEANVGVPKVPGSNHDLHIFLV